MERKIGEIFEYNGEWYQCVKQPKEFDKEGCKLCAMNKIKNCVIVECSGQYRTDRESVIFKKLEKVGEPYAIYCPPTDRTILLQRYRTYGIPIFNEKDTIYYTTGGRFFIDIEIKQNQEDMEEREYSEEEFKSNPRFQHHKNIEQVINMQKMKPFDLEAARSGKPVCTRDGRKARIICFDRQVSKYPIVSLVQDSNCKESIHYYDTEGKSSIHPKLDLMMLPEKHEGWVNIYTPLDNRYAAWMRSPDVYKTREEAIEMANDTVWATVKIEWGGIAMKEEMIEIKKENVLTAYKTARKIGAYNTMKVLEVLFGKDAFKPKDITERIKTFEDACRELGEKHYLVLQFEELYTNKLNATIPSESADIIAYLQLRIICAALNEGWEPKFTKDECRYYPWFWLYTQDEIDNMDEDEKKECYIISATGDYQTKYANFGYAYPIDTPSNICASLSSRLCLKSEELATYCGKQFIDIWADFSLIRK